MAHTTDQVHEMQGLYGPFTLAERVVQKIWLRQDFETHALRLADGRRLEIQRAGAWNLLAGPDFRGARLRIDGREVAGDVEVHFRAGDWRAHGHDRDPAYDNVVLHVVMFPPSELHMTARSRRGEPLPTLVLLPWLNRGLEEYASDDALENLTARDAAEKLAGLAVLPTDELRECLLQRARQRWEQKVRFAGLRVAKLGWTAAAHHTALEILGYRHNRAPMLAVAARYPLAEWGTGLAPDEVYRELGDAWQTQGVRPANHPLRRLRQYAALSAQIPDWPQRAMTLWEQAVMIGDPATVAENRKALKHAEVRDRISTTLMADTVGGTRLDNLVCDGLLPLLAAQKGRDLLPVWFSWFVGDVPAEVRQGLVSLGLAGAGAGPQCHGWAQGLLGWILERNLHASG
ncbi:MAG: hypothetical protein QG602_2077 [Verrucomicrobiota bacterium]|nr:hypothetical protein [Verrucomicrobiota bacterium]